MIKNYHKQKVKIKPPFDFKGKAVKSINSNGSKLSKFFPELLAKETE